MYDELGLPCQWAHIPQKIGQRIGLWFGPGVTEEALENDPEADGHIFRLTGNPNEIWISNQSVNWISEDNAIEAQARFVLEAVAFDLDFDETDRRTCFEILATPFGSQTALNQGIDILKLKVVDSFPENRDSFYAQIKNNCVQNTLISWEWMRELARDTVDRFQTIEIQSPNI